MKSAYTAAEIAEAAEVTRRFVNMKASDESWPFEEATVRGGTEKRYLFRELPQDIRIALLSTISPEEMGKALISPEARAQVDTSEDVSLVPTYDRESLWGAWERATPRLREIAERSYGIMTMIEKMVEDGVPRNTAVAEMTKAHEVHRSTLFRWQEKLKPFAREDWLPALLPSRMGKCGRKPAPLPPEAWEVFKADFLRPEKPSWAACYKRLKSMAKERSWFVPCIDTLKNRMHKEVDETTRIYLREGEEGLRRLLPAQQRTVRGLHALQWINGDGYRHNVFVRWPDGTVGRPKTWIWQDVHSRKILAWRTDHTENQHMIRLAFGDVIRLGIPTDVTIDNTRAAANKCLTGGVPNRYRFKVKEEDPMGIIPLFGCTVHWTSVYAGKGHGQAKPVERQFGVGGFGEYVDKDPAFSGAYTGPDPMNKPVNYDPENAVPFDVFEKTLSRCIAEINAQPGRRTEMGGGIRSFDEVFAESYATATIKKATATQIRMCMMAAESVLVAKDGTFTLDAGSGVGIGRNRYVGKGNILYRYRGKRIVVRFDPASLHEKVYAFDANGTSLCEAECRTAAAFGDADAAREFNKQRNRKVKAEKLAAEAAKRMDIQEVARMLPDTAPSEIPEAGMTEGLFGVDIEIPKADEKMAVNFEGRMGSRNDEEDEISVDGSLERMMGRLQQGIHDNAKAL